MDYKIQPVFEKYLEYLRSFGNDTKFLKENIFWINKIGIIVGFNDKFEQIKVCRVHVRENLSVYLTWYDYKSQNLYLNWNETIKNFSKRVENITGEALEKVKNMGNLYEEYDKVVLTSTGKDSQVVLDLVQKGNVSPKVVFNNTSLDCSDTYKFVKINPDWIVTNPKEGFYQWRERLNFVPTRFSRACCTLFKEGCSSEYFSNLEKVVWIMGIRHEESSGRENRKEYDRNPKWKNENWISFMPILDWTEFDVWCYMLKNSLQINEKYKKGYRRVGCAIACPYYTKSSWALDKYWYPKMYERWQNILKKDFESNQKWVQMNCTKEEYMMNWNGGQVRDNATNEVIDEFANYKGIDRNVAERYFSKTCDCGKKVNKNEIVAMNLKLFGRNTTTFKCKKCLQKYLSISDEKWKSMVLDFKEQGCKLF